MGKTRLIVNPDAGRGKPAKYLPLVRDALRRHGISHDVCVARLPGEARDAARDAAEQGYRRVIAAGGDGTAHEVVNGVAESDTVLAVLPLGTENVLAKELHVPFNLEKAVAMVAHEPVVSIDLGKTGDRYFALMAGVGFDAQVVHDLNPDFKRLFRRLSYVVTGVVSLTRILPAPMCVWVDDMPMHMTGWNVLVSNASIYAGRVRVSMDASIQDGLFDVCMFTGEHRPNFVGSILVSALMRRFMGFGVRTFRARRVRIRSECALPVQLDGEAFDADELFFSIRPGAMRVVGHTRNMLRGGRGTMLL